MKHINIEIGIAENAVEEAQLDGATHYTKTYEPDNVIGIILHSAVKSGGLCRLLKEVHREVETVLAYNKGAEEKLKELK